MARKPFKRKRDTAEDPAVFQQELDQVQRVLAHYPPGTTLSFGAPVRCPICANFGLVEDLDRVTRRTRNRCVSCGDEWVLSARAIKASREAWALSPEPAAHRPFLIGLDAEPLPANGVVFSRDHTGDVSRELVAADGQPLHPEPARPTSEPARPATNPLRILLVEDDPSDIAVVRALLDPAGPDVIDLRWAQSRAAGEAAALDEHPDLVLLDLGLPDSHGFQTVTQWHFNQVEAPVLVVSGEYGADVADRGRELGVTGFMHKTELADLLAAGDEGSTAFLGRLESAAATV